MKQPNPDKFVVTDGTPITVHSAENATYHSLSPFSLTVLIAVMRTRQRGTSKYSRAFSRLVIAGTTGRRKANWRDSGAKLVTFREHIHVLQNNRNCDT